MSLRFSAFSPRTWFIWSFINVSWEKQFAIFEGTKTHISKQWWGLMSNSRQAGHNMMINQGRECPTRGTCRLIKRASLRAPRCKRMTFPVATWHCQTVIVSYTSKTTRRGRYYVGKFRQMPTQNGFFFISVVLRCVSARVCVYIGDFCCHHKLPQIVGLHFHISG